MSFREHLQRVVDSVPGGVSAAVLGFDGIVVDTYEAANNPYDTATILIEYSGIAQQLGSSSSRAPEIGELEDFHIKTATVGCLVRQLTPEYLLAMLVQPSALTGKARYMMRVVSPALTAELA